MDPKLIGEILSGLMFFGIIGFLMIGFPVAFTLAGVSLLFGAIADAADAMVRAMEDRLPGLTDPMLSFDTTQPQLSLEIDRERAADVGIPVTGVPDEPLVIDDQVVRPRAFRQCIAAEIPRFGVEPRHVIRALPDEPHRPVGGDVRVPRPAFCVRDFPFFDRHLYLAGGRRGRR
jgi:hypothetical protein